MSCHVGAALLIYSRRAWSHPGPYVGVMSERAAELVESHIIGSRGALSTEDCVALSDFRRIADRYMHMHACVAAMHVCLWCW